MPYFEKGYLYKLFSGVLVLYYIIHLFLSFYFIILYQNYIAMTETFSVDGYTFTDDHQFIDHLFDLTPEISVLVNQLGVECQEKVNDRLVKKIQATIQKYPHIPQFRNYLAVAYSVSGKHDKAYETVQKTMADFPDYLYAKLNAADTALARDDYESVKKFLGESLELRDLYPERQVFQRDELFKYSKTVLRYHCQLEDIENAERVFKTIQSISPPESDFDAFHQIAALRLKTAGKRIGMEKEFMKRVKITKQAKLSLSVKPIELANPEIKVLYEYDMRIPQERLHEILALPRASLIADLEHIMDDAIARYSEFVECGVHEKCGFVLHAIFLLMELNSVNSLPKILSFLEYDDEFLDFWIGDHKTETIWQCIYKLGGSETNLLKQFLLKPGVDTYSKLAVSDALSQMCLYHVERRDEIQQIYSEVFQTFIDADVDDNLIDTDFLGLCLCDILDCKFVDLLPYIKVLFETIQIPHGIAGDYDKVAEKMRKPETRQKKKEIFTIFQLYDNVLGTWAGYKPEEKKKETFHSNPSALPVTVAPSIGRNDPCPCGSGKKYKKCCL